MRIGILTIFAVPNYGAVLQSHSLSRWLCGLGLDAEVVDYRQPALERYFSFKITWPPAVQHFVRLHRTASFVERHLLLSRARVGTIAEFLQACGGYDAFITGSDQVWFTGAVQYYDPLYFLDFEAPGARKISYAASAGGTTDFGEYREKVRAAVNRIDHIGVRDAHTASLIAPLTTKPITETVDPVFLYDFADLLRERRPLAEPYMLVFGDFRGALAETVRAAQRATGLKHVVTLQYPQPDATKRVASPGPEEWLNWFKHADFVVTSYFHGTVVAAKFQRPFVSVPTPGRRLKVATLLEPLGLSSRCFVHTPTAAEVEGVARQSIDWKDANQRLERKIEASKAFLRNALS